MEDQFLMYRTEDGQTRIEVRFQGDNLWLSQAQMSELFQTSKQNISLHVNNIFKDGELKKNAVVKEYLTTAADGKKYSTKFYNLETIIAVGYRVKSPRGTQFRVWATQRLSEYITKGFTMNDELLKQSGGGSYWHELLERIRDIRSSEKVFYRQLLDLFATSYDYDANSDECGLFFKIVQNKLHYAVNKHTSAETIHERADASQPFMGLKSFAGEQPRKDEVYIAKNYLDEKELAVLNRLVSAFFDLAELYALNHDHIYMRDWIPQVDDFAQRYGQGLLRNAGTVSRQAAIEKATEEYRKYKKRIADQPSAIERVYIESIKKTQKRLEEVKKSSSDS